MPHNIIQPFSPFGIDMTKRKFRYIATHAEELRIEFNRQSLIYMQNEAVFFIEQTTGHSSWYTLTGTLKRSFIANPLLGTLINDCFYSAFVEFGTGIKGSTNVRFHSQTGMYVPNLSGKGDSGWTFKYGDKYIYNFQGTFAHRYMYNAVRAYVYGGYAFCFERAFEKVFRGIL